MKNRSRVIIMTALLLVGAAVWLPRLSRRAAAQSPALMGSYGFTASVPYTGGNSGPVAIVGVITLDGAGNLTGSQTIVSPDPTPNATTVQLQPLSFTGTYTVNADGTGALTTQTAGGGTSSISFVMTDGGSQLMFVQTGGANVLVTGTARKQ